LQLLSWIAAATDWDCCNCYLGLSASVLYIYLGLLQLLAGTAAAIMEIGNYTVTEINTAPDAFGV
jgi:hypothetical protein